MCDKNQYMQFRPQQQMQLDGSTVLARGRLQLGIKKQFQHYHQPL